MPLENYNPESFYDELFSDLGSPRPHAASLIQWMQNLPPESLQQHHDTAQLALFNLGVTFRVYISANVLDVLQYAVHNLRLQIWRKIVFKDLR